MAKVTKDTLIGEAIQIDQGIVPILMGAGMHCTGLPCFSGRVSCRGCNGSRNRCRHSGEHRE